MKQGLRWWAIILPSPLLNGVPMEYFNRSPEPAVVVEMVYSTTRFRRRSAGLSRPS